MSRRMNEYIYIYDLSDIYMCFIFVIIWIIAIVWSQCFIEKQRLDKDDIMRKIIGLADAIHDGNSETSENSLTSDVHDYPNTTLSPRPERNGAFSQDLDDR